MLLPTDPDVQEALDSIGQQVRQNLHVTCFMYLQCKCSLGSKHNLEGERGGVPGNSTLVKD